MPLPLYAGRYQLEELLGRGGMGMVYRATDSRTGGTVAVKVIARALADDREYVERLRREAKITASLTSPRVVRVIDLDEQDGVPFIVLEFVAGPTLDALLRDHGSFAPAEAAAVCLEVAWALDAAHARGIVHRDLKPENIKIVDGQVKVLDFGIARIEGERGVTMTGVYHGTPRYSAPERIGGPGDIRSDIYALGAMLFELLTGDAPYRGPTPVAVLIQHANAPLPELPDDVPAPLRALVHRCLAKSPADRYQTPADLIAALTTVLGVLNGGVRPAATGEARARRGPLSSPRLQLGALAAGGDGRIDVARTAPLPAPSNATEGGTVTVHPPAGSPPAPVAAATSRLVAPVPNSDAPPATAAPHPPALSAPGQAVRPPADDGMVARAKRPRLMAVAAAVLALALLTGGGAYLLTRGDSATSEEAPRQTRILRPEVDRARVTTLAGSGANGRADGAGAAAELANPLGVAVDAAGVVYFTDANRIRKSSPAGDVVTLAGASEEGFANGVAISARFFTPRGIAVGRDGTLYIADQHNHSIRTLSPNGEVRTLAGSGVAGLTDGPGANARFRHPVGVAVAADGTVYVADTGNDRIRAITPAGDVSTLAGGGTGDELDGPALQARFSEPHGIAIDAAGTIYVADTYNARIRAISREGVVRTVAGTGADGRVDGPVSEAQFSDPLAVAVDGAGNLYVLEKGNRLRMITSAGEVRTVAGDEPSGAVDGVGAAARFFNPNGIAISPDGRLYIADTDNRRIRTVLVAP